MTDTTQTPAENEDRPTPPRKPSPKEQYLEQTIEEDSSSMGEGARRDLSGD
jgi:hypothetical protein